MALIVWKPSGGKLAIPEHPSTAIMMLRSFNPKISICIRPLGLGRLPHSLLKGLFGSYLGYLGPYTPKGLYDLSIVVALGSDLPHVPTCLECPARRGFLNC